MSEDLAQAFSNAVVENYLGHASIARRVMEVLRQKNPQISTGEVVRELDRLGWGIPQGGRHLVPWETYLSYVLGGLGHDEFLWFCGVRKLLGRQICSPSCSIGEGEG